MTGDIIVGAAKQSRDLLDWATPLFTLLGVVVVGFYTAYAKKQNKLTEKAMVVSNRAWIIPRIEQLSVVDGKHVLTIIVSNSGRVPGITKRYGVKWLFTSIFPDEIEIPGEGYDSRMMMVPPGSNETRLHVLVANSPEETEEARGGRLMLVYCHIEYTDAFEKDWETALCWGLGSAGDWFIEPRYSKLT